MLKIPESERLIAITAIERPLWQSGSLVAGMDEVGRGPFAGPVVAACVVLPQEPLIINVKDSKKLSEKRREEVYKKIMEHALGVGVGWVSEREVDEINIKNATRKAMKMAFDLLDMDVTDLLVDAEQNLPIDVKQHAYIKGDDKSYLIGAASIVAKVERDRYMIKQHELYPQYDFASNKGYGVKKHIEALKEFGPCVLHRRSFIGKYI